MSEIGSLQKAREIIATYQVKPGVHLLGSVERALTIHAQQRRAHNLAWALIELKRKAELSFNSVCVVGGGIAGLTVAACLSSVLPDISLTILESRSDLCPLQQGSDTRWVHPNIYDWPRVGSRMPRASVPVLSWSEGRAADVAHEILRKFGLYCDEFGLDARQDIYIGAEYVSIDAASRTVDWIGTRALRYGAFYEKAAAVGTARPFDIIIMCAGFGLERFPDGLANPSYWRNDNLGQPILDGTRRTVLISGIGDGGLVDLFRVTIERFRQDTILDEIFQNDLSAVEMALALVVASGPAIGLWPALTGNLSLQPSLERAEARLRHRIRKDTIAILHAGGANGKRQRVAELFDPHSSVLNRVLLYLLYRSGAFRLAFGTLDEALKAHPLPSHDVVCRHGTDAEGNVLAMFTNSSKVKRRVKAMATALGQSSERLWPLGSFPQL